MTETARNILALLAWVLVAVLVASAITFATGLHDKSVCESNGGTFYLTSTVWGCNY